MLLTAGRIRIAVLIAFLAAGRAAAEPITVGWPQPHGSGSDVVLTYSFSNLLDGSFLLLGRAQLRQATVEAMGVWAAHAPLHFVEERDAGPPPSDMPYDGSGHPQIRIGHHETMDLAHGFFPATPDGRAGDVHFSSGIPWALATGHWNFLEVLAHELGHALGLPHEENEPALMNPFFPQSRFGPLGTAFLLPADIRAIQAVYGSGRGSVQELEPIPEPATLLIVGTGLAALVHRRLRSSRRPGRRPPPSRAPECSR